MKKPAAAANTGRAGLAHIAEQAVVAAVAVVRCGVVNADIERLVAAVRRALVRVVAVPGTAAAAEPGRASLADVAV